MQIEQTIGHSQQNWSSVQVVPSVDRGPLQDGSPYETMEGSSAQTGDHFLKKKTGRPSHRRGLCSDGALIGAHTGKPKKGLLLSGSHPK